MISYLFYRLFGWLAPRLPPRLGYWLFARIGDLSYWLDADGRRVVRDNLRHVMGPHVPTDVLDDKVRATFHMQAYNYFDLFRLPAMSPTEIRERVTLEGLEHLRAALCQDKGVIVAAAHFGNVDVLLQLIYLLEFEATLVVEHLQPERLFKYVLRIRARPGMTLIPADASLKPLFRALRAGEIVLLALDRDVTDSGIQIEFFGEPGKLPDGYAKLARHTESPVVPAFGLRFPDHKLRARIEPAIQISRTGDRVRDVRAIMRQVLDVTEQYVAEHPEQWVMFRSVWQSDV